MIMLNYWIVVIGRKGRSCSKLSSKGISEGTISTMMISPCRSLVSLFHYIGSHSKIKFD